MENKITAVEARKLADEGGTLETRVYKFIRESAKEGITKLHYNVYDISIVAIENLSSKLIEDGYTVTTHYAEEDKTIIQDLEIKW